MSRFSAVRDQLEQQLPGVLQAYRRPAVDFISSGIPDIDRQGGIPRVGLTELCAPVGVSSGRTIMLFNLMAQLTQASHFCALVDGDDRFDPESAQAVGVDLSHALWVRCDRTRRRRQVMEQAFKSADILLNNGGFDLIAVDVGDVPEQIVRRVPLSTWFRFRRVAEKTGTAALFLLPGPAAQSFATLILNFQAPRPVSTGAATPPHTVLISHAPHQIRVEALRCRKSVQFASPPMPSCPKSCVG